MYMNPSINFKYYEDSEKFFFCPVIKFLRAFRDITKKEIKITVQFYTQKLTNGLKCIIHLKENYF